MPLCTTGAGAYAAASGASYSGPGDVVSGANAWWGLRAYSASAAAATKPAIDIVDQSGANPLTVNLLTSGDLDKASVSAWVTAHSVTSIKVNQIYDQVGTNHLVAATAALLDITGLPFLSFTSSQYYQSGSSPFSGTTTNTISHFINRGTGSTGYLGDGTGALRAWYPSANTVQFNAGSFVNATIVDGAWQGVQAVLNTTSSDINVDGTSNTGNAGSSVLGTKIYVGTDANISPLNGSLREVGVWSAAFTGTQSTSMKTNQHGYWG